MLQAACAAICLTMRMGGWRIGIGIGQVDDGVLAEIRSGTIRTGRGSTFIYAREAVEQAKKHAVSLAVVADNEENRGEAGSCGCKGPFIARAQAILHLIRVVVSSRTPAQRGRSLTCSPRE